MERKATEYVEFKTVEGVDDEKLIQLVNDLEERFHSIQPGFISTELCKAGEGHWVMVQHWGNLAAAKAVVKQMMQEPITLEFRQALDPTSVKMKLMEQVKIW